MVVIVMEMMCGYAIFYAWESCSQCNGTQCLNVYIVDIYIQPTASVALSMGRIS